MSLNQDYGYKSSVLFATKRFKKQAKRITMYPENIELKVER
jgi:hypothetical protein